MIELSIDSLEHMNRLAQCLARCLGAGDHVFLHGPLGVGKSSWTRFFLRARGFNGVVPSPTYSLVHSYHEVAPVLHHFDLYRLNNIEELDAIGFSDYYVSEALCVIEWPDLLIEDAVTPALDIGFSFAPGKQKRLCSINGDLNRLTEIKNLMIQWEIN